MKNIIYVLKSLYSNQAAIDGRKKSWIYTLVVFLLDVFIIWIPILSKGYTANNSKMFSAAKNGEFDMGIKEVINNTEYFKNININSEYQLDLSKLDNYANHESVDTESRNNSISLERSGDNSKELGVGVFFDAGEATKSTQSDYDAKNYQLFANTTYVQEKKYTNLNQVFFYDIIRLEIPDGTDKSKENSYEGMIDSASRNSSSSGSSTIAYDSQYIRLQAVYFPNLVLEGSKENKQFVNNFIYSFLLGAEKVGRKSTLTNFPHSYIIFTKDAVSAGLYPIKSTTSAANSLGNYYGDLSYAFKLEYKKDPISGNVRLYDYLVEGDSGIKESYKAFLNLLDIAGRKNAHMTVWFNVGIASAVVVGSILLATIILFILCKRKSSIYKDVKYPETIKIATDLALSPVIIGTIIIIFKPTWGMIAAGALVLVRLLFTYNKICPPPAADSTNKPLYQARS